MNRTIKSGDLRGFLSVVAMFSQWFSDQDELLKFISGPHNQQQEIQPQNELLAAPSVSPCFPDSINNIGKTKPRQGRRRKASAASDNIDESPADYMKKIIHRDVERQRRQEMAGLYRSLCSKIPPEFLQGKRSMSDHIQGTIRYIRYMQTKKDELKSKRDRLKDLLNPSSSKATVSCSKRFDQTNIAVKPCWAGIEISLSTVLNGGLLLSRVLNVLLSEGMSIKSCISIPVREKILHIIVTEVNEEARIDQNELKMKLMGLVFSQ